MRYCSKEVFKDCKSIIKSFSGSDIRGALKSAKMSSQDTEKYNMILK